MTAEEAFGIVEAISGYWPTPSMEPEEVKAWVTELAGPANITYGEAGMVTRSEGGRQWRPRPGEFAELVRHYRRQEALRIPLRAVGEGGRVCTPEENLEKLREVRRLLPLGSDRQELGANPDD